MAGSFGGLSTALSALTAQRRGLDVTGQNIANANTDGYSRQRVGLQATGGSAVPAMFAVWTGAGSGVESTDVVRLRDAFLDARARTEHATGSYLTAQQQVYGQVEGLLAEPSDTGLQAQLGDLWSAWHDVANNPGDQSARAALLQRASTVTGTLNDTHAALASLWSTTRDQLDTLTADVNSAAARVAELNQAVVRAKAAGIPANELADERGQLTLHLAELTGATVLTKADGATDVLLGGSGLVNGSTARKLEAVGGAALGRQPADPAALRWTGNHAPATVPSGQLASVLETLGSTLPGYADGLDQVAANLAGTVNAQHASGYDLAGAAGRPFFTGSTAGTIAVAVTDPAKVAASGRPGANLDGGNADAMAGMVGATGGADRSYRQLVAQLGGATQTANRRAAIQASLATAADASVAAQSGVNLDEEMTNMLTYQRAYEAAARVMSTMDSALDTLINHMAA
jgi:flagellar hook-associated protein 1 FlgK